MSSYDPSVVAYHVRRLDSDALRALVADLWSARGFETTVEDGTVRASDDSETVRIAVGVPPRDGSVDVVVTPHGTTGEPGDRQVVDATDVAEMLRYAVGPAAARDLCERHLGAPPEALRASPATRLRRRATGVVERTPPALVVLAVVVVVGLAGLAQLPAGPESGEDAPAATNVTADEPATPVAAVSSVGTPAPRTGPDWRSPPSGGFERYVCEPAAGANGSGTRTLECVPQSNESDGNAG